MATTHLRSPTPDQWNADYRLLLASVVLTILMVPVYAWLSGRIIARTPHECLDLQTA